MNAQNGSRRVIVVRLPPEPRTSAELETVTQVALSDPDCDVVMDFADLQTVDHPTLCGLLILHRALGDAGQHLFFCNTEAVRDVFKAHRISRALAVDCDEGINLEPLTDPRSGGTLVLARQDKAEACERRRYVRLNVSKSLKLTVLVWHPYQDREVAEVPRSRCWRGTLIDVSEGGAQVAVDLAQEPAFHKDQFISLRFAPVPYEMPITFDALVREVLPTADDEQICLGVQFIGLEANSEGHRGLQRLCSVEGRYFETIDTDSENFSRAC
jgi:hypothetical protein